MIKKENSSNFTLVRKMENFDINQRTSDGMFNATFLLNQWNGVKGNTRRRMDKYLSSPRTQEFIKTIKENEGLTEKTQLIENQHWCNPTNVGNQAVTKSYNDGVSDSSKNSDSCELQHWSKETNVENQAVTKSYNDGVVCFKKGRMIKGKGKGRTPDEYWFHPFLFIDFAMYLNPKFQYAVIKFVYDNLVALRVDIAKRYKAWTSTLKSAGAKEPEDYQRIAKCMNYVVFGKHFEGIRDHASKEQIMEMQKQEDFIIKSVEYGLFTNLEQIRGYLKKEYDKNHSPKCY